MFGRYDSGESLSAKSDLSDIAQSDALLPYDSAIEGAVTRLTNRGNKRIDQAKNSGKRKPTREQREKITTMAPYNDAVSSHGERESLSPAAQAQIGRGLRAIFDDIAREPIPDDLLRLLEELETRDK